MNSWLALSELLKPISSQVPNPKYLDPEFIKAVSSLVTSLVWPIFAVFALVFFKPQIEWLASQITEIKVFGIEAKIKQELKDAEVEAEKSGSRSAAPTEAEIARASKIDELTTQADINFVRRQVDNLAAEYEKVRSTQRPGEARTRSMEAIVAQMRAIGRAAWRFRYELKASPSPGKRLQAIASLQVLPDYDLVEWLARESVSERPFVAYHALVGMNVAAGGPLAEENLSQLKSALQTVREATAELSKDSDRKQEILKFEKRVSWLSQAEAG